MSDNTVLGAFSEAQVERLTGVSIAQLRRWDRTEFFKAALRSGAVRAFSRVYSFKDLVSLRVLNKLRNVHNVSMPELRKTARDLAHLGDDVWTTTTLYVHRGRVVFDEPETLQKREVTTKQYIADIPLEVVISNTRDAIALMNRRDESQIGHITRNRFVQQNKPVIAGTRIPVAAIQSFARAGYSPEAIVEQYPGISVEDVRAALEYQSAVA